MKTYQRIALALIVAAVVFWLIRLGGWVGSLTTQRLPLYFTLNQVGAWVAACIAAVSVFINSEN